eukprot:1693168-Amphidinium_carterae.1
MCVWHGQERQHFEARAAEATAELQRARSEAERSVREQESAFAQRTGRPMMPTVGFTAKLLALGIAS